MKECLDFIADLFHRSSGAAIQSQGLEHVPALRLPDETVHLWGQGGAEHCHLMAAAEVSAKVLPR
ncbi:hypothetical protein B5F22_00610 [Pseudoflavonifractor sp. An187]|nr:hypothetical protein B5F22_00610 [Pseudoflavonifractor sp. An187]